MRRLEAEEAEAVSQEDFEAAANLSSELDALRSSLHCDGPLLWWGGDLVQGGATGHAKGKHVCCSPANWTPSGQIAAILLGRLSASWSGKRQRGSLLMSGR